MAGHPEPTEYMDKPARMLMETLKHTLGMWVNEIADDAASKACERAGKVARERVATELGKWAAQSTFDSRVDYQKSALCITLTVPFAAVQNVVGKSGMSDLLTKGMPTP